MRYTTTPGWLLLPRDGAIRRTAKRERLDIDQDGVDYILDLLCRSAGAKLRSLSEADVKAAVAHKLDQIQMQVPWYHFSEEQNRNYADFVRYRYEFLNEFTLGKMPGRDPLTQAVRALKLVKQIEDQSLTNDDDVNVDVPAIIMEALEQAQAFVIPYDLQRLFDGYTDDLLIMIMEQLVVQQVNVKEMINLSRQLTQVAELQGNHHQPVPDPNGNDMRLRGIRCLSELPRITQASWGLPRNLLVHRLVAGELQVREPVTRHGKKQLLYMLIDGSGSMLGVPAGRAAGVVLDRLQAVMKGDAEVFLRFFDVELREREYHADNATAARCLLRDVVDVTNFLGGDTDFATPLETASERVRQLVATGHLRDPEIVMVTDGEAPVPTKDILGSTKLHAVQVGDKYVKLLGELAKSTGGADIFATPKS